MGASPRQISRLLLTSAVLLCACEDHSAYLAREPAPHEWGTFGEELFRLVMRAAVSSGGEQGHSRGLALATRRDPFVEAADLVLPVELHEPARIGLAESLRLVDDGSLPRLTRGTAELASRLAGDRLVLEATVALRDQPWCASRRQLHDLLRHAASTRTEMGQDAFVPLVAALLGLVADHDGIGRDGLPRLDEPAQARELMRAVALELGTLELPDAEQAHPFGESIPERLLAALGIPDGGGPVWVVRADPRGVPRVRIDPSRGTVYPPFVDADRDGLADVDQQGRLVDPAGRPVELEPYGATGRHASDGRALAEDGRPVYEYVDFSRSAGGVLARGARAMVRDAAHDELGLRVETLLGPRRARRDDRDGAWYSGFDPDRIRSAEPVFDLVWALLEAMRDFPPDRLLLGLDLLVRERRGEVLSVLEQSMEAGDVVEQVGLGELARHNSLLDDLLVEEHPPGAVCYGPYGRDFEHTCVEPPGPLLPRLVRSGVLEDLLGVLDDPRLDGAADALATMMRHRDRLSVSDMRFDEQVDHDGPESAVNRSTFQRLLHLVHDSNDAHFDTWLGAIGLTDWRVDSLAIFYLESYCGEATLPSGLHRFMSEFSSDRPSPEEVTRFIVSDQSGFPVFANPVGREGRELWAYNADTLLAVEASGLMEALRPILGVFCDHGELLLFANLLSVLHEHFSTLPDYTTEMTARHPFYGVERPAGLRAVEGGLAAAVTGTDLFEAYRGFARAGGELTLEGRPLAHELVDFVGHLIDPAGPVMLRAHEDAWRDTILRYDGLAESRRPTHANVVYQRVGELGDLWSSEDPTVREELTAMGELLADYFLDLPDDRESRRDDAEHLVRLAEAGLPIVAEWAEESLDRGSWREEVARARTRVDETERRADELLAGPLLPALLDVVALVREDPEARAGVRDLVLGLLSTEPAVGPGGGESRPIAALARVLAALVQMAPARRALERAARFLSSVLDPVASPLVAAAGDLALLTGASPESAALRAMARSLAGTVRSDGDLPPLAVLAEALAAIGRAEPGAAEALRPDDLASILGGAARLLVDSRHGLERVYAIVGERDRGVTGP